MFFNKYVLSASIIMLFFTHGVNAKSTGINISGTIVASTCTIDNSALYRVIMPDVGTTTLASAGGFGDWTAFDVTLSRCPTGLISATANFSGTADNVDATKYANQSGEGFAKNVSVQLQNSAGEEKGDASSMTVRIDSSRKVTFPLKARPYTTTGGATAGNITSVVMISFTYN